MNFWDIIYMPFGYLIKFLNAIVGNQYILALLLFAVIVEIILLPFGIKQQKNSIKQAKLRPKEMAIRKKYAGREDTPTKQKMSMEIQELYQKEGYNPMGGCLPLLIQLPIILILYNLVMNPLQYIVGLKSDVIQRLSDVAASVTGKTYNISRNIDLLGDIQSLDYSHFANVEGFSAEIYEKLPNLKMFGGAIDLGATPSITTFNWLLLIPILTFVAYFLSMKLTRKLTYQPMADDKAMGCSNNIMDIMMPLFSVYIAFVVPAAIGVYWIFKSILGILKQFILKKAMPIPTFTEEDYKAAEKELNVRPEKAPKNKSGKIVRSLHHIDDEDFEDTAEAARKRREALEAQEAEEAEKKANNKKAALNDGLIKEDDRAEKNKEKLKKKAQSSEKDTVEDTAKDTNDTNDKTDGE
ncbi:MAG: YidC/Oxa1 family membrane protein insertase [Clostridia bacterium]|nr:YidC/Oxa1 family membrane protein insertase [Clostridia bacterium]